MHTLGSTCPWCHGVGIFLQHFPLIWSVTFWVLLCVQNKGGHYGLKGSQSQNRAVSAVRAYNTGTRGACSLLLQISRLTCLFIYTFRECLMYFYFIFINDFIPYMCYYIIFFLLNCMSQEYSVGVISLIFSSWLSLVQTSSDWKRKRPSEAWLKEHKEPHVWPIDFKGKLLLRLQFALSPFRMVIFLLKIQTGVCLVINSGSVWAD